MTGADAPAPYRTSFDNARDPYTARNALGITAEAIGAQPAGSYALAADFPATAWTVWSPTVSSGTGTITSSTVNIARYAKAGKTITAFFDVTIVNQGTGASYLRVTLPVMASGSGGGSVYGVETAGTLHMVAGQVDTANSRTLMTKYDGSALVITGYRVKAIAIYEAA